jgi:hypothetical protein
MNKSLSAVALLGALVSAQADASCVQSSVAGSWTAYSVSDPNNKLAFVACTLVINSAGTFAAANSVCASSVASVTTKAKGAIKLINGAACAYQGSITLISFGETDSVKLATLSINKDTVSGVGVGQSGGVFVFNMVKIK